MSTSTATSTVETSSAAAGSSRTILNPATGQPVGEAPVHTVEDLERAVAAAQAAQPAWAALGHDARSASLMKAADAVERSAEELARLLSREQGKPLNGPNARFEVGACAAWLRAAAGTPLDPETVVDDGETRAELHYRPIGVVGAIGPWNWPMLITVWQIGPALRMGNAVVVKPSEYTPLSVLALVEILNQELPEGLLTVVSGGRDVGEALAGHPAIGKIMFTGSTATGKAIIKSSADTVKRLTLELGGNDAGIVLPDADPQAIAEGLFWGAFINTGQTCAALKRLYVHTDIYDAVCEALTNVAAAMPMGNGLDEANVLGPLQNRAQYDIVARLVE
ncbi:aldehyde dehydrogenase family protein, partial [Arthrobacter sp. I3]|uniref:aldehyde dehydrogenase family protein n=1 Tax=Arthrobacter sp. I3 TaxID=218158 RepID=UPI0005BD8830